jgi:GDP-L-fucose synthase
MNICVFGSTGMVGRNLVNALVELETHNVLTPSRLEVNLLDYSAVFEYLKTHSPDLVIHCAGIVGGIQANIENPVKFLTENTTLGNNVILGAKEAGVTQLINLSSSCVYPRNAKNPLSEEQILTGELEPTNEGYALAKIYAMRLCEYIGREDPRFLYKTIIPPNLYGPFDNFHPQKSTYDSCRY